MSESEIPIQILVPLTKVNNSHKSTRALKNLTMNFFTTSVIIMKTIILIRIILIIISKHNNNSQVLSLMRQTHKEVLKVHIKDTDVQSL